MEYRLNKYISASGYCSRREADKYIENGNVTIDGKKAVIGSRVLPGQKVRINGNLVKSEIEPIYIAFNKPVGIVCSTNPLDKDNIIDYIQHEQRIFPIGRLDKDSQGLILLTNDGDIVNKILRAGNNHKKEYIVTVNKPITPDFLTRMSQGVPILDRVTRKCEIEKINPSTFKITLIQGLNRQIRRMCEYFDYEVVKLERIRIMNIKLDKLGQGNWRPLTVLELEGLFDLLKESEKTDSEKNSSLSKKVNQSSNAGMPKKSSNASANGNAKEKREQRTETKNKAKTGSGPRVGKSKALNNKPQARTKSEAPKRSGHSKGR